MNNLSTTKIDTEHSQSYFSISGMYMDNQQTVIRLLKNQIKSWQKKNMSTYVSIGSHYPKVDPG